MSTKQICIVGHGPTGSAVIHQLYLSVVDTGDAGWTLYTVDKDSVDCGGPAFGAANTGDDDMLCNMPAGTMSITDDASDFVNWLIDEGQMPPHAIPNEFFASRRDYGRYLSERTKKWLDLLRKRNVTVKVIEAEVLDITRSAPEWKIKLSNGESIKSEIVVMTTGGFASSAHEYLHGADQAIMHAYPFSQLEKIPRDQSIGVIGNSLTTIDVTTRLDRQGHAGRVFVTSSNCVFPMVRPPYDSDHKVHHCLPQQLRASCKRWGSELTVGELLKAFERDCEEAGIPMDSVNFLAEQKFSGQKALVKRLEHQLTVPSLYSKRFSVINALSNHMPEIWKLFSEGERARWRETEAAYAAAAFPCPPANGKKLMDWLSNGRLIVQGNIARANGKNSKFKPIKAKKCGFDLQYENGLTQHVDWIVNATGLSYDLTSGTTPSLYKLLHKREILTPNGHMGVLVDFDTCAVINHQNHRQPGLYVVGPLTRGVHYYTNSVAMNAASAKRAVADIIDGNASPYSFIAQMEAA